MQLYHCTGQYFFGPTKYPGRRPSTIEVFERNEFPFFTARTPPVQSLSGRLHKSTYLHMAPQCWQALTFGCAAQKAVVSNANKTFRQDVLRKSSDKFQLRQLHVPVSAMLAVVFVTNPYIALPNLLKPWLLMAILWVYFPKYSITCGKAGVKLPQLTRLPTIMTKHWVTKVF
jgi:hypothetical protein